MFRISKGKVLVDKFSRSAHTIAGPGFPISLSDEVKHALDTNVPIVALESTIISHGMPYPDNVETAKEVENIVREAGCVPATVAVANGYAHVGLEKDTLELIASPSSRVKKIGRRDIMSTIIDGDLGATTVSATMYLAHLANVKVFATGGIGGVHRGAEYTFDISADLTELGRTPVAVVCAGVKSILDVPKTLEYLETLGVPVLSYDSVSFPVFYSADPSIVSPRNVVDLAKIAKEVSALRDHGMLVAVPPPNPVPLEVISAAIEASLREAEVLQISGKDVTPFLLKAVNERTGGKSLQANIGLIKNNAAIAAKIAMQLSSLKPEMGLFSGFLQKRHFSTSSRSSSVSDAEEQSGENEEGMYDLKELERLLDIELPMGSDSGSRPIHGNTVNIPLPPTIQDTRKAPICVGGAVLDVLCRPAAPLRLSVSNPGVVTESVGGVAHNISRVFSLLSASVSSDSQLKHAPRPLLVTSLGPVRVEKGDDKGIKLPLLGEAVLRACNSVGIDVLLCDPTHASGEGGHTPSTGTYVALLAANGGLHAAVADMDVFRTINEQSLKAAVPSLSHHTQSMSLLRTDSSKVSGRDSGLLEAMDSDHVWGVVVDGNVTEGTLKYLAEAAAERDLPFVFDPISTFKAPKVVHAGVLHLTTMIKPNEHEVVALANAILEQHGLDPLREQEDSSESSESDDCEISEHLLDATRIVLSAMARPERVRGRMAADLALLRTNGTQSRLLERLLREMDEESDISCHSFLRPLQQRGAGACIDGRKHVLVSLGPRGLLWASAAPRTSPIDADLMLLLPFSAASIHPRTTFDFQLCAAPQIPQEEITKVTGAGDTVVGSIVWALNNGFTMPESVRFASAAAAVTLTGNPQEGAIPSNLSVENITKYIDSIEPLENEYN